VETVLKSGPKLPVKKLEHGDCDDPGEKRDHLVHKAADEAYGGTAKEEQEHKEVECSHMLGASGRKQPMKALL
jgi:hypothetical protein